MRYKEIMSEAARRPNLNDAFWRWFGNSKIVDAQGQPLQVYHGTASSDITSFMPHGGEEELAGFLKAKAGNQPFGFMNFRSGSFFSPDPDYAGHYTTEHTGLMYPVYIKAENPVYIDQITGAKSLGERKTPDALVMHESGKINEIAIIDPRQVKSVFNRGTWDANDPRIDH
jgi:ADP-Ribosyltransferase in polyvalent proteins